jgi:hypothetical protein
MAMIAMTTSNSINVNAFVAFLIRQRLDMPQQSHKPIERGITNYVYAIPRHSLAVFSAVLPDGLFQAGEEI